MSIRLSLIWPAFIRFLVVFLILALALTLFLALNPAALRGLILLFPIPGAAVIPDPGPTPPPPVISVPRGAVPDGDLAFTGVYDKGEFSCGFLLALDGGRRVGISAAHATAGLPEGKQAQFQTSDGHLAAVLTGQIARGRTFTRNYLNMDYVIWTVADNTLPDSFLKPDPRGQGQPGERVLVLSRFAEGAGGFHGWPGVVMSNTPEATWVQLEDAFNPRGYSGCPVVSLYTGQVIGMAVAGENKPPVVMGLHPVGSLVEKAEAAFRISIQVGFQSSLDGIGAVTK